jgi:hypothetical protein
MTKEEALSVLRKLIRDTQCLMPANRRDENEAAFAHLENLPHFPETDHE